MEESLTFWCDLYEQHKFEALCLDIEVTYMNGPISVVGLYTPKNGPIQVESFIRGQNLTEEALRQAFRNCRLLITFNGVKWDVPKIRQEFPTAVPEGIRVVDLYLFARRLDLNTNLKVLESTFRIGRLDSYTEKRHIAVKLWRRYETYKDMKALATLIEYNKQDTANLYPLAEELVKLARQDS